MARTRLFKKICHLLQQAHALNEPVSDSRRAFLKTSLAASALLASPSFLTACQSFNRVRPDASAVAILGGGIAGLSAAYALTKAGHSCVIFEATSRVGGRMFSKTEFNAEKMVCELGGEFVDSNHAELIALCKEFGIALDALSPGDQNLESNLYYFNGKYWTDRELLPRFQPFAKKLSADQKRVEDHAFSKKMDQISLEAYLQQFKNVEKWVIDLIRVAYVGEYGLEAHEQSSLNLIGMLSADTTMGFKIFGDSDQEYRIRGGNQALITALENYLAQHQVSIFKNSPVQKLKESASGIEVTANNKTQTFSQVICSIPFSVLRNIEGVFELNFSELKKKCIREMGYATCSKMMMGYRSRLWRQGLQKEKQKIPASNGMVYTDLVVQNLWETSRGQSGNSGILTSYTGGNTGEQVTVKDLDRFLQANDTIFPGTATDFDQNSAVMNWSKASFYRGAYACPKPGQITELGDIASKPELKNRFLFAGEHAADQFQGYMNGGCRSGLKAAELVLNQVGLQADRFY